MSLHFTDAELEEWLEDLVQVRECGCELSKGEKSMMEKIGKYIKQRDCENHEWKPSGMTEDEAQVKFKEDMFFSPGAVCEHCDISYFRHWWCPKSPNHICHYSRSLDSCDYCGRPEERK